MGPAVFYMFYLMQTDAPGMPIAHLHSCQELIQADTEEAAPVPTLSGLDPDSKRSYAAKGYIELGETY